MRRFVTVVGLGVAVVLGAQPVDAQYRYTDDKGASKVTQYKLDVPAPYRDSAVWIGPTGVGKPGLSEEQRQIRQRWGTPASRRADDAARKAEEAAAAAEQAKKDRPR
jgi:hypothetical protein